MAVLPVAGRRGVGRPVAVGAYSQDQPVWIAIDPDHPRRRVAFGDEQSARRHANGLTPAWTVLAADNSQIVPITGIWPGDVNEQKSSIRS